MTNKFKNIFLVCLDYGDDLNHVVARNPSLKKARHAANLAKKRWPEQEVYITVEKTLEQNPLEDDDAPQPPTGHTNREMCACGSEEGGCLSNLSCHCPAIALCKQMKLEINPFEPLESVPSSLESVEINVISIRRGIVEVVIPDWDPEETIGLSPNEISEDIMPHLEEGVVLEVDVNLDAVSAEDLVLQNLRLVYEESDENEGEDEDDYEDMECDNSEDEDSEELSMPYYQYMNPQLQEDTEEEDFPELPGEDETEFLSDDFEENSSFEE